MENDWQRRAPSHTAEVGPGAHLARWGLKLSSQGTRGPAITTTDSGQAKETGEAQGARAQMGARRRASGPSSLDAHPLARVRDAAPLHDARQAGSPRGPCFTAAFSRPGGPPRNAAAPTAQLQSPLLRAPLGAYFYGSGCLVTRGHGAASPCPARTAGGTWPPHARGSAPGGRAGAPNERATLRATLRRVGALRPGAPRADHPLPLRSPPCPHAQPRFGRSGGLYPRGGRASERPRGRTGVGAERPWTRPPSPEARRTPSWPPG